jgi:hypothetical protein
VPDLAFDGAALLVSIPQGGSIETVTRALIKSGASVRSSTFVGSHATRYRIAPSGAAAGGRFSGA